MAVNRESLDKLGRFLLHGLGIGASSPWIAVACVHQAQEHHQSIDITELPVAERSGQRADDLKAVALPTAEAGGVGAHHQGELHRAEPQPPCHLQRVLAEAAADPHPRPSSPPGSAPPRPAGLRSL